MGKTTIWKKTRSIYIQESDIVPATGLLHLRIPIPLQPEPLYEVEMHSTLPPTVEEALLKYAHPSFSKAA